jgi:hypothetical protein
MALRAVLIGPDGTVFKDGRADQTLLDGLVIFIKRMQAKGVHVGLWSRHAVVRTAPGGVREPVQDY